jgi:hypothetical protein
MHYAEGDFFMPMSKLMEQVIAEVVKLPEKQQNELAETPPCNTQVIKQFSGKVFVHF